MTFEPLVPAASSQTPDPATRAGEPVSSTDRSTSSRPMRGRLLAGVLAASMVSAVAASVGTVGLVAGLNGLGGTPADGSGVSPASTSGNSSMTITGADAIVAVAESASPSVVTLTVELAATGGGRNNPFGMGAIPSTGVGSGFIFDAEGLILTNNHVIEGDGTITVTFQDGTDLPGTVVTTDPLHDLAVVKVDATGLPALELADTSKLQVGQLVVAIGSPLGHVHRIGDERHPVRDRAHDRGR